MTKKDLLTLEDRWQSLNIEEKEFIYEFLKEIQPKSNQKIISEARWWNTVADIVGIVDPTGIFDLLNGLDYIRQGDYFFGLLSMISVIPYVGDAVAKPLMFAGKAGKFMKPVSNALKLAKNGNTVKASLELSKAAKSSSMLASLVGKVAEWGPKLKGAVNKIPGGKLTGGLRKTINDWIDLFMQAGIKNRAAKRGAEKLAKTIKGMPPKEASKLIADFTKTIKSDSKLFKNFKPKDPTFMAKYFWPGATVGLLWRNRQLTSLTRRTKFYAGFLDFLGLGNWVGPEELTKTTQMSEEELNKKFQTYVNSNEGISNWGQDFGNAPSTETPNTVTQTVVNTVKPEGGDPFAGLIMSMFK